MKIVTVNIPEAYIKAIEKLVGEEGLYPSRSELIRCATKEFLLKELKMAKNMLKHKKSIPEEELEDFDTENFIRIPVEPKEDKQKPVREFKTYKILRRLESSEDTSESGDLSEIESDDNEDDFDEDERDKYFKSDKEEDVKPTLKELRIRYPYRPEYRYINEGEKGSLLNI